MKKAGFEGAEIKDPKVMWMKAGKDEVRKTLDKEEAENRQQRFF